MKDCSGMWLDYWLLPCVFVLAVDSFRLPMLDHSDLPGAEMSRDAKMSPAWKFSSKFRFAHWTMLILRVVLFKHICGSFYITLQYILPRTSNRCFVGGAHWKRILTHRRQKLPNQIFAYYHINIERPLGPVHGRLYCKFEYTARSWKLDLH